MKELFFALIFICLLGETNAQNFQQYQLWQTKGMHTNSGRPISKPYVEELIYVLHQDTLIHYTFHDKRESLNKLKRTITQIDTFVIMRGESTTTYFFQNNLGKTINFFQRDSLSINDGHHGVHFKLLASFPDIALDIDDFNKNVKLGKRYITSSVRKKKEVATPYSFIFNRNKVKMATLRENSMWTRSYDIYSFYGYHFLKIADYAPIFIYRNKKGKLNYKSLNYQKDSPSFVWKKSK